MRQDRAWYEKALADELRADYVRRREDVVWAVRDFGGQVTFGDEPDWETRAKLLIDAEIAAIAYNAIRERMKK